ncbi:MAG: collagen-like protein [Flavobacteriales bacterium]
MKKLFLLLAFTTPFLFTSCIKDDEPDTALFLAEIFETTVNFSESNGYRVNVPFPSDLTVYESDAVLVYLLEGVTSNGDDIWSQLPQTYFLDQGTLLYSFDHTFFDTELFLDANFDLSTLGSTYTSNQTFRIVIVPAEYASADLTMDALLQHTEVPVSQIESIGN